MNREQRRYAAAPRVRVAHLVADPERGDHQDVEILPGRNRAEPDVVAVREQQRASRREIRVQGLQVDGRLRSGTAAMWS
jgi:hypothetical protein